MNYQPLWDFARQTCYFLVASAIALGGSVYLLSGALHRNPTYVELILVAKGLSLFGLIVLGGELLYRTSGTLPGYLRRFNVGVIACAVVALLFVLAHLSGSLGVNICSDERHWICELAVPLSALPIAAYAGVNLIGAVVERWRDK